METIVLCLLHAKSQESRKLVGIPVPRSGEFAIRLP